ncbi:MAG: response regulator [Candidatus Kuenenbacteria bacterium]
MHKTILIIEDEQTITKALATELKESNGFKIETASDGEQGWQKAKDLKPDLVILDLILPKLDGFSVLQKIKSDEQTKNIPVVVLTNLSDVNDKVRQLGAQECLIKSDYTMNDIKNKIKNQLS